MSTAAHVDSIEALKLFKRALFRFAEMAGVALVDAESELQRTLVWVETEQLNWWQNQVRKRHELVERCKEAVRMKKLFKGPTGQSQSAVDEEKALARAQKALQEAEQKVIACRQWGKRLQKEIMLYLGQVQRFATSLQSDVPTAAHRLEAMIIALEQYAGLSAPVAASSTTETSSSASPVAPAESILKRGSAADASLTSPFAEFRSRTPSAEVRAAARPFELHIADWETGPLPPDDAENLQRLNLNPQSAEDKAFVIAGREAWKALDLYFERVEPTSPEDSGWVIGVAGDAPAALYHRFKLDEVLSLRPEWKAIFDYPVGSLIVISGGAVKGLLNNRQINIWPAQPHPSPETEA